MKVKLLIIYVILISKSQIGFAQEPTKESNPNKALGVITQVLSFMGYNKNFGKSVLPKEDLNRSISSQSVLNYESSGIVQSTQGIDLQVLPVRGKNLLP